MRGGGSQRPDFTLPLAPLRSRYAPVQRQRNPNRSGSSPPQSASVAAASARRCSRTGFAGGSTPRHSARGSAAPVIAAGTHGAGSRRRRGTPRSRPLTPPLATPGFTGRIRAPLFRPGWPEHRHGPQRLGSGTPCAILAGGAADALRSAHHRGGSMRRSTGRACEHYRRRGDGLRRRTLSALVAAVAIAWPLGAREQQPMPVIGYLDSGSPEPDRVAAFQRGLNETGYVEGQNIAVEYLWAQGRYDRLPGLVADLIGRQVTGIVARGVPTVQAAKAATATIPIVFTLGVDPVQFGLVASLNRPGGNITGVVLLAELAAKRLDLLHELIPTASIVALLVNPTNTANTEVQTTGLRDAARSLQLQLHILPASSASEIDDAFQKLVELRASALVVAGDPFFTNRRAGSPSRGACDLRMARVRRGRRPDELRTRSCRRIAPHWAHRTIDPAWPRRRGHRVSDRWTWATGR